MTKILTYFLLIISTFCSSQNKSLNDSTFKIGDIIRIPEIVYVLDGNGHENDSTLKTIANFINSHKNIVFEIGSHSDSRGKPLKNSELTVNRAKSVRLALIERFAVNPDQITSKGYGMTKPLISDITIKKAKTNQEKEELHQKNRRTELKIISINGQTLR